MSRPPGRDAGPAEPSVDELDRHPILLTRAHPKPEIQEGFDDWQRTKHLPDLMRAPGAEAVVYALNVLDGLPQLYRGSGYCLALYVAPDLDSLFTFLSSSEVREAVADGSGWFDRFNDIDYETYTGNVYEVIDVVNQAQETPHPTSPLLVERWEVPRELEDRFDGWLRETHLPAVGLADGVRRARTFRALREDIPIPYYYSQGSRALVAELDDDLESVLLAPRLFEDVQRSLEWDCLLPYVRRDVYRHAAHATAGV